MNIEHPDARIVAYLDGELSSEERAAFERELESSEDLRSAVEYERRFNTFMQTSLSDSADEAVKSRLLEAVRTQTGQGQAEGGRVIPFPFRVVGVAVAAALAGVLLWTSGLFDAEPSTRNREPGASEIARGTYPPVFSMVMKSNRDFERRVADESGDRNDRIRQALSGVEEHRVWTAASHLDRMSELESLLERCLPHDVPLPVIPEGYELVGYGVHVLPLESYPFRLPQAVFTNGDIDMSLYVLCGEQADVVERALADSNNAKLSGMSGCSRGGWVARRYGKVLLVFVSKTKFGLMCDFARRF